MTGGIEGCVPVVYVTDVPRSVRYYELLGLVQAETGADGEWRWSYLTANGVGVLLAAGGSVWSGDPGPVLLYLRVGDIEAVAATLRAAGASVEHMGYPAHAQGGEFRTLDPDGHGVLVGQVRATPGLPPRQPGPAHERTSILARAAETIQASGEARQRCQFPLAEGTPCPRRADVKLADSWGDSAWTCLPHAEEIMINAKGTFLATEDSEGLGPYLRRRLGRAAAP